MAEALKLLVAPWEEQVAWMRGDRVEVGVDELALNFGDSAVPALDPGNAADTGLSAAELDAVRAVYELFDQMSGQQHAALWTEKALRESHEWGEVRRLAVYALGLLAHRPHADERGGT